VIDSDGYRPNVGIILCNAEGQVFWARRSGQDAWQFPQGGIREKETPDDAMYRELHEETGLMPDHVSLIGKTQDWLHYKLPKHMIRKNRAPICIGQKQIWFVLKLTGSENNFNLSNMKKPEFDDWAWVDYWYPMKEVVFFKKDVYQRALSELEPLILGELKNAG
jgi:putative (di)nucleoside polyphosphate hydrolase